MKNHQQNNGWIDNRTVLQININGKNNNIILRLIKNNLLIDSRSIEVDVKLLLLSRSVLGDPWRMHRLRDTGGSLLLCLWRSWLWLFEITWTERENTAVFLLLLFFGLGTRLMPISKEKNKSQRRNKTNFSLFVVLPSSSFFLFIISKRQESIRSIVSLIFIVNSVVRAASWRARELEEPKLCPEFNL